MGVSSLIRHRPRMRAIHTERQRANVLAIIMDGPNKSGHDERGGVVGHQPNLGL
jgi:hypothetical protein